MKYIPLILSGVLLNAVAQLFLKKGMAKIGYFEVSFDNIIHIGTLVISSYFIWFGLLCYAFSVVIYLIVLSRVDVSYAYPFLSLGFVLTAIIGRIYFGEVITMSRIVGIAVIIIGVIILSKS